MYIVYSKLLKLQLNNMYKLFDKTAFVLTKAWRARTALLLILLSLCLESSVLQSYFLPVEGTQPPHRLL